MSNPLVTTSWLAARIEDPAVKVIDASWHMPDAGRDAAAEYASGHIPGAVFFGIDEISDHTSTLPHMLSAPPEFAVAVRRLGIDRQSTLVVYDTLGIFSAPRVWWNFRAMGHKTAFVLDGGWPKWIAEGRPLESGWRNPVHGAFKSQANPALVRSLDQVRQALADRSTQLVDARSAKRFSGAEPEPRAGLRSGHVPGARNVPWSAVVAPDGTLAAPEILREVFTRSGVDLTAPIITTCGSGISAAILALALARIGRDDVAVYDGSWSEWGARTDTPVALGAP